MTESKWQGKYKTIKDYYAVKYPEEYFSLTKFELDINPDESVEDLNKYDTNKRRIEFAKCALDFFYFAHKYIKILHPKRGLIPFVCYKYQHKVIGDYDTHRFNIVSKFRQGGLTTLTELWGMWRCMFKEDQQIVLISKTDREAIAAGEIINRAVDHLPVWMKPSPEGKWNDHKKEFHETGGSLSFHTPEAARGLAITYLILDEAAFIPEMDKHWKAMYPTLSTGGNCIVISTVNGLGNWYEKYYHRSKRSGKPFHVIDLDFTAHPEYNDPAWETDQRAQLGEKGWQQEVLRSFLGSGETYIPPTIVSELVVATQNNPPIRKLFKKWVNKVEEIEDEGILGAEDEVITYDNSWEKEGACWIWREPREGEEFIIGVDAAEGVGDGGDNSCIQIFETVTMEQVAEFYSNSIQPYQFAQVLNQLAMYYNHGLVVIENMGSGGAVISNLQHNLFYDNLYFETSTQKMPKAGIKTTLSNRLTILEALQSRCINRNMKINSRRLVTEITTFTHNVQTGKIGAQKGSHDDAILAACLALYVRDLMLREMPLGSPVPQELIEPIQSLSYAEIRREIMDGVPKSLFVEEKKPSMLFELEQDVESMVGIAYNARSRVRKLLEEFGWAFIPIIFSGNILINLVGNVLS